MWCSLEKWNLPKGKIPSWLSESAEVTQDSPKMAKDAFVVYCMHSCIDLGCAPKQAAGITANAVNESAWGQSYRGNNLGGWKITQAYASEHPESSWWRAPGNKATGATEKDLKGGDPPWCYYRAFHSVKTFLGEWITHFVPDPNIGNPPYPSYSYCGRLFWGGSDWFQELIHVGYKGSNTKRNPRPAIAEHEQLVDSSITRWAQSMLGVAADGKWGEWSRKAAMAYMADRVIPSTGELDDALINLLAKG